LIALNVYHCCKTFADIFSLLHLFKVVEELIVWTNCLLLLLIIVSEVEEGAVYQIEDVWDGTQWHKSKKTLSDEAANAEGVLCSVTGCD